MSAEIVSSSKPQPIFEKLLSHFSGNEQQQNNINEAKLLHSNGKFYYATNEYVGALVSYSCSAVLLNSIIRAITDSTSTHKALFDNANELLNCCLRAVQTLQEKTKSSKPKDDADNSKDWGKICTNLQPLIFSKGSSDCLFFSGVAGLRKEKELFRTSLIFPLMYPNLYPKSSKGILIYGPPGTGKTFIVKAAVNELQKTDKNVAVLFFAPSPGDLKGKYVGETEKKIEEWFTCASKAACDSQLDCNNNKKYISLIFMDEFDAIAQDRNTDTTGLAANSVNTLLQMMDGIKSKPNVTIVAATNYPWNLDSAILRRFDTQILIDLPDNSDLLEVLNIEMRKAIKFKNIKDSNAFCNSEKDKYNVKTDNSKKNTLSCKLECEEEKIIDLSKEAPYNQMEFDFYKDIEDKGGFVTGLIQKLQEEKFSNSDIVRLFKSASTYTGQMCIKANLFYSAVLLDDFRLTGKDEKFISCITQLKAKEKALYISLDIIKSFINPLGQSLPQNIYQISKPDICSITYGKDTYINSKCLFYKNNELDIDHPLIKDVYIKFDYSPKGLNEYEKQLISPNEYDVIITFDFTIKETSSIYNQDILLPISRDLIERVFKPINELFQGVKTIITEFDKIDEMGNATYIADIEKKVSEEKAQSEAINTNFALAKKYFTQTQKSDEAKLKKELVDLREELRIALLTTATAVAASGVASTVPALKSKITELEKWFTDNNLTVPDAAKGINPVIPSTSSAVPVSATPPSSPSASALGTPPSSPRAADISADTSATPSPTTSATPSPRVADTSATPSPRVADTSATPSPSDAASPSDDTSPIATQNPGGGAPQRAGGKADEWGKTNYKFTSDEVTEIKKGVMFNISDKIETDKFFTTALIKILEKDLLPSNESTLISIITNNFNFNLNYNNYDFYNCLLLHKIVFENNKTATAPAVALEEIDILLKSDLTKIDKYLEVVNNNASIINIPDDDLNKSETIVPFIITLNSTGVEFIIYLDKNDNTFYININIYPFLIPSFQKIYELMFTKDYKINDKIKKNTFIKIDISAFLLLFKNSVNSNKLIIEYELKAGKKLQKNNVIKLLTTEQILTQIYINNIYNFDNLCTLRQSSNNTYLSQYLQGFIDLPNVDILSLCQLICVRLYNNYNYVCFDKIFILDKNINLDTIWNTTMTPAPGATSPPPTTSSTTSTTSSSTPTDAEKAAASATKAAVDDVAAKAADIAAAAKAAAKKAAVDDVAAKAADIAAAAKAAAKKAAAEVVDGDSFYDAEDKPSGGNTLKRKNYKKSFKNKSSKNKRKNNIENKRENNIENNIENTKIYGGARISPSDLPIYQYKTFINFCQSNSDENELSTATILDKKIYIKTKFNIETIKAYRKSSLIGAVYYGTKNLSSYVYNSLTKSATQTESDKKKQEVKLLEELKKKKLYLPFLFKDVTAIGFLKQESLQKTIDDNDILASDKDIKINWVVLDKNTIKSYLLILIDSIKKNPVPVGGLVVNSVFGSVVNPASITPAEVVLTNSAAVTILSKIAADNSTAVTILSKIAADNSTLGVDIVAAVADSSTTAVADSSTTAVAAASTTAVAATTAAAEGWISSFLTYATSLTSSAVSGVTSAGTVVLNTVLAHQLAATTAILYSIVDAYRFSTDNQLDVNLIIYDSYIEAIFTTIIDTRYISMVDSDKDPAQVFIEDINKIFFDISTLLNSLKSKIRPYTMPTTASRTTIDSDILRYKGKNNEPEDIKNKLTNLNIPLRAFAYALTEVKSTYTAKTGEMLKEYYDNKDKFMQKLEEDRKKK